MTGSRPTRARLAACFDHVRRSSDAPGVDGLTPTAFARDIDDRIEVLASQLQRGDWRPERLLRIRRPKPDGRVRRLGIPTVTDRIVIEWLRRALERRVEPTLSSAAYAYRPGRSPRTAVDAVLAAVQRGADWVALADIRDFFDTIRHRDVDIALRDLLDEAERDRLLPPLRALLRAHRSSPGKGVAQGSALSPLLSNLAMKDFDESTLATGATLIRYSDNLCLPAIGRARAAADLASAKELLERRGLHLKPEETGVASVEEGFAWLGFWVGAEGSRVSQGAVDALRAKVDRVAGEVGPGALRVALVPLLRGWIQYYDTPLPAGADLGPHGELVRAVLDEMRPAETDDVPESSTEAPLQEEWGDPWDDWAMAPDPLVDQGVSALLDEAERLVVEGDFAGAERAHEAARELGTGSDAESLDEATSRAWDPDGVDAFLGLFLAGASCFEVAPPTSDGTRSFMKMDRPPGPVDVVDHLEGRIALAVIPRAPDGTATLGVVDIDAREREAIVGARAYAVALSTVAQEMGATVMLEETGGRGLHVWVGTADPVPADAMAEWLDRAIASTGQPAEGVTLERLPGRDAEVDLHEEAMTLPLGCHLETGRRSELRWLGVDERVIGRSPRGTRIHYIEPGGVLRNHRKGRAKRFGRRWVEERPFPEPCRNGRNTATR